MHYKTHFTLGKERMLQLIRRSSAVIVVCAAVFLLIGLVCLIVRGVNPDSGEAFAFAGGVLLFFGVGLFVLYLSVVMRTKKSFARGGVQVMDCDFNDLTFEIALSWTDREMKTILRGNYYFISSVVEFDDRWQIHYDGKVVYNILKGNALKGSALRFPEREVLPTEGEVFSTEGENSSTEREALPTEGENSSTEGEVLPTEGEILSTEGEVLPTEGENSSTEGEVFSTEGEVLPTEGEILSAEGEKSSDEREIFATDEEFSAFLKEKLKEKYTVKIKKKN